MTRVVCLCGFESRRSCKSLMQKNPCPGGEIGKRGRLKPCNREVCGFKSRSGHQLSTAAKIGV